MSNESAFRPTQSVSAPFFTYEQVREMNVRFAHAMFEARRSGNIRLTAGPIKDDTAMVPTHFERPVTHSLCTSGAALCEEAAGSQRRYAPNLSR